MVLLQSRLEVVSLIASHSFDFNFESTLTTKSSKYSTTLTYWLNTNVKIVKYIVQIQQLSKNYFIISMFTGVDFENYMLSTVVIDYNKHLPKIRCPISDIKLLRHFNININGLLNPDYCSVTRVLAEKQEHENHCDDIGSYHGTFECDNPNCHSPDCWSKLRKQMLAYYCAKHIIRYSRLVKDEKDIDIIENDKLLTIYEDLKELRENSQTPLNQPLGEKYKAIRPQPSQPMRLEDIDPESSRIREIEQGIAKKMLLSSYEDKMLSNTMKGFRGTPFGKSAKYFA